MKLKEDQKKLRDLLKETITLLIKSGLEFKKNFCVEALIGITLDDGDGFFLSIKDTVQALNTIANKGRGRSKSDLCDKEDDISYIDSDESEDSLVQTTLGGTKRHSSSVNLRKRKSCQDHSSSQVSPSKQVKGQSRETTITNQVDEPLSNSSSYQLFGIRDESSNSVVKHEQPDNSPEEKDLVLIKTEATEPATDNYSYGVDTMSQTGYFSQEYSASERPNSITGTGMWNTGHHQIATGAFDSSGKPDVTGLQNGSQFQANRLVVQPTSSAKFFICPLCAKPYRYRQGLKDHMRAVHGMGNPLKCECGETFLWRMTRDHHKKTCTASLNKQSEENT